MFPTKSPTFNKAPRNRCVTGCGYKGKPICKYGTRKSGLGWGPEAVNGVRLAAWAAEQSGMAFFDGEAECGGKNAVERAEQRMPTA